MGAGASAGISAAAATASPEEIKAALSVLSKEEREKLKAVVGGNADAPAEGADAGGLDYEAMMAHKGDYESQKEKIGPAPDFTDPKAGWYWYGQDGSTGPELTPETDGDKPKASERKADVFYVHPTSYYGLGQTRLWNMPLDCVEYNHTTDFHVASEASAFNGSCRVFAPKFRQSVLAGMMLPCDEAKLAQELAYADVKQAFEYYLANENKGRPFVLASHSQGSLYIIRLMLDFIEGKPLFSQFVACYGLAAWVPLSLFEGEKAVFKQIKVSRGPTDAGCFISWTCEHPDTVKQHGELKDKKEGGWYPVMGHKVAEAEWRIADGEAIVCTHPLTWASNGLGDAKEAEDWLGMLSVFDNAEHPDCDTFNYMCMAPNAGLEIKKMARITPDEFNAKFEDGTTKFDCSVDEKTGDLQVVSLPASLGGSETESYEHMNYSLFWFNIRKNVATRLQVMTK